jgi:hypothetical protein
MAELFAGAISMGLGAWLAAVTDEKEFEVVEKRERRAVRAKPAAGEEEIYEVFEDYNIPRTSLMPLADHLIQNFDLWIKVSKPPPLKDPKADLPVHDGL